MVNLSGISFDHRVTEQTGVLGHRHRPRLGRGPRHHRGCQQHWDEIEALGSDVKLDVQLDLFLEARRMTERGVLWLLRRRRPPIDLAEVTASSARRCSGSPPATTTCCAASSARSPTPPGPAGSPPVCRSRLPSGRRCGRCCTRPSTSSTSPPAIATDLETVASTYWHAVRCARRAVAVGRRRRPAAIHAMGDPGPVRAARRPAQRPGRADRGRRPRSGGDVDAWIGAGTSVPWCG